MGNYKIFFNRTSEKTLKKLPQNILKRVLSAISGLAFDPHPIGSRKLHGFENTYRIRVGDYRIIYEIIEGDLVITVIKLGHRKDVYKE